MEAIELIVLVGIQASGKTTFYRRHLAETHLHVSLDNWRGKSGVRRRERTAILACLRQAAASGGRTRGLVIDNTNTTTDARKRYFEHASEFQRESGVATAVRCLFFDADLASCLRRNADRPKEAPAGVPYYVPPAAIRSFAARLQPPGYAEGFARISRVRIAEGGDFEIEEVQGSAEARGPS